MIEIGLVVYPGAQQAAVLGLTDLFMVANRFVATHRETPEPASRLQRSRCIQKGLHAHRGIVAERIPAPLHRWPATCQMIGRIPRE